MTVKEFLEFLKRASVPDSAEITIKLFDDPNIPLDDYSEQDHAGDFKQIIAQDGKGGYKQIVELSNSNRRYW